MLKSVLICFKHGCSPICKDMGIEYTVLDVFYWQVGVFTEECRESCESKQYLNSGQTHNYWGYLGESGRSGQKLTWGYVTESKLVAKGRGRVHVTPCYSCSSHWLDAVLDGLVRAMSECWKAVNLWGPAPFPLLLLFLYCCSVKPQNRVG